MTSPYRTKLTSSGATVVIATGRLNFPDVDGLRQQLGSLVASGANRVVVDLSGVQAIDSSGIGALISGLKAARHVGGDLRLTAPTIPVASVLETMNLDTILTTHASAEDAFPNPA
jgi:anti-anti-sigma factor